MKIIIVLLMLVAALGFASGRRYKNEVCREKPMSGAGTRPDCHYTTNSWTYFRKYNKCIGYMSGNCGEEYNGNRFETLEACNEKCVIKGLVKRRRRTTTKPPTTAV